MIEENKYYTPQIEEFHVGFEYELKADDGGWCYSNVPQEIVSRCINDNRCRVKYLDKEDIQSLGWIHDVNMSEFDFDSFYIEPGIDNKKRFIQYGLNNYKNGQIYLEKVIDCGCNEIELLNIKNKSELKKLMQQLSINGKH